MKLLIKLSKDSIKKAKRTIKDVFTQMRGKPVGDLIMKLNLIIRGTGNYWSTQIAKKIFEKLDRYIWIKGRKHLKTLHNNKSGNKWGEWFEKDYFKPLEEIESLPEIENKKLNETV